MSAEEIVAPAGVTVSTLLPSAAGTAGSATETQPGRKKFKKHRGVKVRLGRDDDVYSDSNEEIEAVLQALSADDDGGVADDDDEDSGRVIREVTYTGTRINLPDFKKAVTAALKEFLAEEEYEECLLTLRELHTPFFHYEFVRRALTLGIERSDRERELISRLLSYSYGAELTMDQIGKGFERLFENIDDLALDVPGARAAAAKFTARAIADEILPPAYLNDSYVASLAGDIVEGAKTSLSVKHSTERLEHVWHITGAFSVPELKASITLAVKEYFTEYDLEEAIRCIKELNVPLFHHEVVYRILILTLETWPDVKRADAAMQLLSQLNSREVVSAYMMGKGFERCKNGLEDIVLDAPEAKAGFSGMEERAQAAGLIAKPTAASA